MFVQVDNFRGRPEKIGAYSVELSICTLFGVAIGYTAKKGAKKIFPFLAVTFIALQLLAYNGYIDVRWKKVERDTLGGLDQNRDGRVTREDVLVTYRKGLSYVGYRLPSITALAVGAGLSFKYF
jgi:uncharacterized membrane protein (Fun14 family)